jgi:hypothetical protein
LTPVRAEPVCAVVSRQDATGARRNSTTKEITAASTSGGGARLRCPPRRRAAARATGRGRTRRRTRRAALCRRASRTAFRRRARRAALCRRASRTALGRGRRAIAAGALGRARASTPRGCRLGLSRQRSLRSGRARFALQPFAHGPAALDRRPPLAGALPDFAVTLCRSSRTFAGLSRLGR